MIPYTKKLITAAVVSLFLAAGSQATGGETVLRVIDGDTFVLRGGVRIRVLGIDAPERGARFSDSATSRLKDLVLFNEIMLERCGTKDDYGRTLAVVQAGKVNVGHELLRDGLALPMLIPPCGRHVAADVLSAAGVGAQSGTGIFSLQDYQIIRHNRAGEHIGEHAVVRGKVLRLYKGPEAWHLNFGENRKTDFTAVLFKGAQQRYADLGLDPNDLVGMEVLVIGKLKSYNGPEIIVNGPEQILPIGGNLNGNPKSRVQEEISDN